MPAVLARPRKSGVLLRGVVAALSALPRVSPERAGRWGAAVAATAAGRPAAERAQGHQQPVAAGRSARGSAAERAQVTSSPQRRSCCAQRRAAGQHRGGRRTAPGSAANATHLDRRGLRPSLAPAPRRGCAATASIAGRRPAHSSNVHCDEGACRVYSLAGFTGLFFFQELLQCSVQSRSVIYNTTSVDTRHWPRTRRGQDGLRGQCQPDE